MIRVLFVDHTPFAGGAQLALTGHIRHLDPELFEPLVACTAQVPRLVAQYQEAGARVHLVPLERLKTLNPAVLGRALRSAWRLRRLIRSEGVDLVVANTSRAAYVASLATAGTRVPLVWWVRDFLFGRTLFRLLRTVPARIICVSEAIRSFYGGTGDPRFATVYVSSETYRDEVRPEQVAELRGRWGLSATDVVVGFMGRLVRDKGPDDVIGAIRLLHADFPRLKLLLVGTGKGQENDIEPELRRLVAQDQLEYVVLTGFQSDEALYYRLFDVFVLATREPEPFATSVVQAMMARRPVVATATGGSVEAVFDRRTGLLVPPGDPSRLAAALRSLLEDPEMAARLAEAGYRHAVAHYRQDVITRQIEQIYREVTDSRRSGSPAADPNLVRTVP